MYTDRVNNCVKCGLYPAMLELFTLLVVDCINIFFNIFFPTLPSVFHMEFLLSQQYFSTNFCFFIHFLYMCFFISHISIYAHYTLSNFLLILISAFNCSLYATNLHFFPHTPSTPYAIHTSIQQTCTHYFVIFFFRLRTSNGSYMFT